LFRFLLSGGRENCEIGRVRVSKRYGAVIGKKSRKQIKCGTNEGTEWDAEDKKEIISAEFSSEITLVTT